MKLTAQDNLNGIFFMLQEAGKTTQSTSGRRLLVRAGIAVLLSAWPQTASAGQSPAWWPVRAGIISIRLESNKSVYQRGEPIKLRVTLVNHTAGKYVMLQMPPWALCDLSVRNGQGRSVRTTLPHMNGVAGGDATYVLPPYGSVTLAWADIKWWLYDLDKLGDYVIVGHPYLWVSTVIGDHFGNRFVVPASEASNPVHITIAK
jgi:hypothetical protein